MRRRCHRVCLAGALGLLSCVVLGCAGLQADRRALIIVDMQYDFLPGGSIPIQEGDQIVGLINKLQAEFDLVVATQDWHPGDHVSFASNHPGQELGDVVSIHGGEQILWPDHSIQGSHGAKLVAELDQSKIAQIFQKGMDPKIDSYSGFFDNEQQRSTGLGDYLKDQGVTQVYVVGLALDYCVKFTALDARSIGFDTTLIVDASRSTRRIRSDDRDAVQEMKEAGIHVVRSESLLKTTDW